MKIRTPVLWQDVKARKTGSVWGQVPGQCLCILGEGVSDAPVSPPEAAGHQDTDSQPDVSRCKAYGSSVVHYSLPQLTLSQCQDPPAF